VIRLTCEDLGFACDHVLAAENEAELVEVAKRHVLDTHGRELDANEVEQLRALVRARVAEGTR
jgi:predicted small metal-binding protein